MNSQSRVRCTSIKCIIALGSLLVGMLWLVLARAGAVQAAGVVGTGTAQSCTSKALSDALAGGGLVTFHCGTSAPVSIIITQAGGLALLSGTTIDGTNYGNRVTLSGANNTRVLTGGVFTLTHLIVGDGNAGSAACILEESGTAMLDDVTVQNCHAAVNGPGGAIYNVSGNLTIVHSRIVSNTAGIGAGIYITQGTLTLNNSTLSGNAAYYGAAIYSYGISVLNDSILSGNTASGAFGGMVNYGTATLHNSILNGNVASGTGGGFANYGIVTLNHSTLSGNTANGGHGGGLANYGTATLNSATLSANATILSASGGGLGGGIYNYGAITLNDSTLSGNVGHLGGGIYNHYAALVTLNNTTLSANVAESAGGGMENDGAATLNSTTFSVNAAANDGGGLENDGAATLTNSTLSGNSATYGGGMENRDTAILNNSTFNGNSATYGGGMANYGIGTLTNSTLSANSVKQQGGGIYNQSQLGMLNVTLSNNSAAVGGALFVAIGSPTGLTNTILAYSKTGGNCNGTITASKFTLSSDNSCMLPAANTIKGMNPNGLDPLLTGLGNYGGPTQVHLLKPGSPAIDGVVGSPIPTIDQRGFSRAEGDGSYDIGAVERQVTDSDLAPRLDLLPIFR